MDEIVYWFKKIVKLLKEAIFLVATIIAVVPFLDIGTKIFWIVILGIILFVIAPSKAGIFISTRSRKIIYGYVIWIIIVTLITEVLIPSLQSL